jgi:hypothetical protein
MARVENVRLAAKTDWLPLSLQRRREARARETLATPLEMITDARHTQCSL